MGTVSANLAGTASLVKNTGGTLVLSGTNTYSGGTQINGGVLSISADANLGAVPALPTAGNISLAGGTCGLPRR